MSISLEAYSISVRLSIENYLWSYILHEYNLHLHCKILLRIDHSTFTSVIFNINRLIQLATNLFINRPSFNIFRSNQKHTAPRSPRFSQSKVVNTLENKILVWNLPLISTTTCLPFGENSRSIAIIVFKLWRE